ncbi:MAG TPA: hypothetical protein VM580_24670 [Labilithrix sp.]|nr:hypothetical protein [Labilithrix sp.]
MQSCAAHPETPCTTSCSICKKAACERCLTYEVEDAIACRTCGAAEGDRGRALGSAMLALVGVGYLATLALGYVFFRGRPFVGGLAAVVALALGRALHTYLKLPMVSRRSSAPRTE